MFTVNNFYLQMRPFLCQRLLTYHTCRCGYIVKISQTPLRPAQNSNQYSTGIPETHQRTFKSTWKRILIIVGASAVVFHFVPRFVKPGHDVETQKVAKNWQDILPLKHRPWTKGMFRKTSFTKNRTKRLGSNRTKRPLNSKISLYRKMPLKTMSRWWGHINQKDIPVFLRKPLLGLYAWMFSCNVKEAAIEDLKDYRNLGEFFRRSLKPNVRPIDEHIMTSPSDGKVLHCGKVDQGVLEQVKGVKYSLNGFLGPLNWKLNNKKTDKNLTDKDYHRRLGIHPNNDLFYTIVYLAPGDYHRFHSPAQWTVKFRRHFPGELLSVSPGIARWIQGLFNFNERVVYYGNWKFGFFTMTAVGATNVGSIKIYFDKEVETNLKVKHPPGTHFDKVLYTEDSDGNHITMEKGEPFGEFNLGSTVVLIFEAPKDFLFQINPGQKIKVGQGIGLC